MITITNCFKVEPDLDKVSEEEWRICEAKGEIDLSYIKSRINLQDESALELTLRFREHAASEGLNCRLSAVSAGDGKVTSTLQTLAALGFTRTDRTLKFDDFNPEITGEVLADYLSNNDRQDLIICGGQSGCGSSRAVPLYIAYKLNIPCIINVKDFVPVDNDHIRVSYVMDGMEITDTVKMPVVLAVGDVQQTYLRVPTLKQRMEAANRKIEEYDENSATPSELKLKKLRFVEQKRESELIDGSNPVKGAAAIYERLKREGMVE